MIFQRLRSACSKLWNGYFFQLIRGSVAMVFPSRFVAMEKYFILRWDRNRYPGPRPLGENEVLRGDAEVIPQYVRDLYDDNPKTLAFYEQFYREGVEPCFVRQNGKIVGALWAYGGKYLYAWEGYDKGLLCIEVEPTAKFFANGFVDPAIRRQGISTITADAFFAAYPESEFYTLIKESNFASIISREKVGFRCCCTLYFFRVKKTTFCLFLPKKGKRRWLKLVDGRSIDVTLVEKSEAHANPNNNDGK